MLPDNPRAFYVLWRVGSNREAFLHLFVDQEFIFCPFLLNPIRKRAQTPETPCGPPHGGAAALWSEQNGLAGRSGR